MNEYVRARVMEVLRLDADRRPGIAASADGPGVGFADGSSIAQSAGIGAWTGPLVARHADVRLSDHCVHLRVSAEDLILRWRAGRHVTSCPSAARSCFAPRARD